MSYLVLPVSYIFSKHTVSQRAESLKANLTVVSFCCAFFLFALIGKGEKWLTDATWKDSVKMELIPNQVCPLCLIPCWWSLFRKHISVHARMLPICSLLVMANSRFHLNFLSKVFSSNTVVSCSMVGRVLY